MNPARVVVGTESEKAREIMSQIYQPFTNTGVPIIFMDEKSSELTKYAANSFLAVKITFMNEIANYCEKVGADVDKVRLGMGSDDRIGHRFLFPGIGYGGSCFPKDTKALKFQANQVGYHLRTVEAAVDVNTEQKIRLFKKASDRLITFEHLKVAVLGLAFKPGTDDLREAPSLDNVKLLLDNGADIYAYDPVAAENFRKKYPEGTHGKGTITYVKNPEDALQDATICFIFTEWKEVKTIAPETYSQKMRTPLVYDGRNVYAKADMEKAGVEYYSIGR